MDQSYTVQDELFNADAASEANIVIFAIGFFIVLAILIALIVTIAAMWKLFAKAGKPGWTSLVPFYNTYVMVEIAGRPTWWFAVIVLVPFVGGFFSLLLIIDFVKAYGKGVGYGVLTWFVPYVTLPLMAFDKSVQYGARSHHELNQSYGPEQTSEPPTSSL